MKKYYVYGEGNKYVKAIREVNNEEEKEVEENNEYKDYNNAFENLLKKY